MRVLHRSCRAAGAVALSVAGLVGLGLGAGAVSAAPILRPGDTIRLAPVEYGCTVGLTGTVQGSAVAVTAGHCAPGSAGTAYRGLLGGAVGTIREVTGFDDLDFASFSVNGPVARTRVASPGSVGDRVCKTGRMTGVTCGSIVAVTPTTVVARVKVLPGDSGGPLKDSRGRVIGITSRLNVSTPAAAERTWVTSLAGNAPIEMRFPRADRIVERISLK